MAEWVDNSVEARGLRRAVREGRKRLSEVPWWVMAQKPPPGSGLCPDCGHAKHDPKSGGKACNHVGCYCYRANNVDGSPRGRLA